MAQLDSYGFFGPDYSYSDNIRLPNEIGVRRESSFGAIFDAVGGINHYLDVIAFGGPFMFDRQDTKPMGIRYFLNTEMRCSNGASMSEYFDGVTKGDLLGENVALGLESAGLPGLKGLAPGMLENARDALDPRPIMSAVNATGYPVCQQVVCPVGDTDGVIANTKRERIERADGSFGLRVTQDAPYIIDPVQYNGATPTQTRWVQELDASGNARSITKGEFAATPKCYNADGTYQKNPPEGCPRTEPPAGNAPIANRKYGLCRAIRNTPAVRRQNEGFEDMAALSEKVAIGLSIAALAGVALWSITRK